MKSLYFDNGALFLMDIPKPEASAGETLVKVCLAGVCRTDIEICKGYMDYSGVLGHEFVGEAANGPFKGSRVVGEINVGCGTCFWCMRGLERHCPNRTVLGIAGRNGAFAEYCLLPDKNLLAVPDEVSDEEAIFTEPLAAALEIREQMALPPVWTVAIIGDGRLAYLTAQVMRLTGNCVVVFGKHPDKLKRFKALNVEVGFSGENGKDRKFPVVVECSGHPSGLRQALELLEPRGTLVLKSTYHEEPAVNLSIIVINEWKILGSRCGLFAPALELLRRKEVEVTSTITDWFPLSKGHEAMERASQPDAWKVVLETGK